MNVGDDISYMIYHTLRDNQTFRISQLRTEGSSGFLADISHFAPGSEPDLFFSVRISHPKQPKLELLISHFAPIRHTPITLHTNTVGPDKTALLPWT